MLFGSKQRILSGRSPDHYEQSKTKEILDHVQTQGVQPRCRERPPQADLAPQ